jgi:ubiquitin-protein ligase E3 C
VIKKEDLGLFFSDEVQLLISGGKNEIDIDDLRRNTFYHGFRDSDPYIREFWNYLRTSSNEERENFLLFVTGTNRPPLLGFKYLNPQFCIHQILLNPGEQRLPTSQTCMNMLKLPHYGDPDRMKQQLSYAINSNSGFGLG